MSNFQGISDLSKIIEKGHQPSPNKVTGGHQPTTSEQKPSAPKPPPKKP